MKQADIEAFLTIIECGSISAAAQKLYIGQPTISARIQALENELNATLFHRGRGLKNTELTVQGKSFEPYARKWMQLWSDTQDAVTSTQSDIINIAAGHTTNAYLFPEIYPLFSDKAKSYSYQLSSHHFNETYNLVESAEADFGFTSVQQFSRTLLSHPLFEEESVLLTHRKSFYPDTLSPKELDVKKEIYNDWSPTFRQWHNYWLGSPKKAALQNSDITFAKRFISAGDYWIIVPKTIANLLCTDDPELKICTLTEPPEKRITYLLTRGPISDYPVLEEMLIHLHQIIVKNGGRWLL